MGFTKEHFDILKILGSGEKIPVEDASIPAFSFSDWPGSFDKLWINAGQHRIPLFFTDNEAPKWVMVEREGEVKKIAPIMIEAKVGIYVFSFGVMEFSITSISSWGGSLWLNLMARSHDESAVKRIQALALFDQFKDRILSEALWEMKKRQAALDRDLKAIESAFEPFISEISLDILERI